jgi:hypothetical protein
LRHSTSLLQGYQQSQDFLGLRERTRTDYIRLITKIAFPVFLARLA